MTPQTEIMKLVQGIFRALEKARSLCGVTDLAALGRHLPASTTPKHAIKRVEGFLGNPRFRLLEAFLRWVIWSAPSGGDCL